MAIKFTSAAYVILQFRQKRKLDKKKQQHTTHLYSPSTHADADKVKKNK